MNNNHSKIVIRNGRRFILLGILLAFIFTFTLVTSADPIITVTKSDALLTDADNSSGLTPGDTIRYTIEIENTGDINATNVVFDDVIDNQTTLNGVAHISPIAFDDSYSSLGNVGITVPAVSGVLANDVDPDNSVALSVTAAAGATTNGGVFAISSNGSFSYLPPVGFEGTDTFNYTLTDGDLITPNTTGTVTITVNEVIWFVDKSAGAGGTGVLSNPFNDLTGASGYSNAVDDPGDIIFIYDQQIAGNYNGSIILQNNQFIVGQGATASIAAITGITLPPHSNGLPATGGSKPVLSNSAGNNVVLAQNNTVQGISLDDSTGGYGFVDNGGTVGNLAISETNVGGTGGAVNIANGGTLAVTLEYANSVNSPGFGINLNDVAGSFTVTGNSAIINSTNNGIRVDGSSAIVAFQGSIKTINTGAQTAVNLTSNTGTIDFSNGGLDIDTTSGTGFSASNGGSVNISGSNNSIASTSGSAVDIDNTTLNVTLNSVASTGGTVPGIDLDTTTGTFSVTGDGSTAGTGGSISGKTGNTDGVTLNNASGVSLAFMNINNNSRNGLYGLNLNGLTLNGVTLNANADQFSPDEAGLLLEEVSGTVNITNSTVSNSFEHNVKILNSSGTLTAFNLTGGTIGPNPVGTGAQGLLFQGTGTANMTLSVDGTTFTGNLSNGIFADTAGGTMDVTVQNSIFENNNVGVGVSVSSSGNMTFDILNNPTIRSLSQVQSLGIRAFANASHSGTFAGTISGNTVGSAGTTASGSIDGSGISASNEGSGTMTLLISGNTVQEIGGTGNGFEGIFISEAVNAGTTNATITGNTIRNIRDDRAIQVSIPSGTGTVCSNISGNTFNDTIDGDNPINANTRVIRVRQLTGTHNVVQSSQANLASVNSLASGNITVSGTINFGASACATPSLAATSASSHLANSIEQQQTVGQQTVGQQAEITNSTDKTAILKPISGTQPPVSSTKLFNSNSVANTLMPIGDVNEAIGTLPLGKKVTIIFDVTVNTPTQASDLKAQICNTGSVTADTGINVNSNQICRSFQTGTINIIKDTVPNSPQDFGFTASGGLTPATFSLDDDGDGTLLNTQSFISVTPGSYNVSEDDPNPLSYQLTNLICDDNASNVASEENVDTRTATINLEPGETISCIFTNEINRDWGDLPDTYGTAATTGASHLISGPYLGPCLDGETSGVPSANALADNNATGSPQIGDCATPDDEDGVNFANANNWSNGNGRFDITVNNGDACLNAWLDFTNGATLLPTGDGDFDDSLAGNDEHIVVNMPVSSSDSQPIAVSFTLPNNAADGAALYLRVRLTERDDGDACNGLDTYAAGTPTSAGHAFSGEVEDYQVAFTPTAVNLQQVTTARSAVNFTFAVTILGLLTYMVLFLRKRSVR